MSDMGDLEMGLSGDLNGEVCVGIAVEGVCVEVMEEERVTSGEDVDEHDDIEEGDGVSNLGGGISMIGLMVTRTQAEATRLGGYLLS
jgi:hypothetical protein